MTNKKKYFPNNWKAYSQSPDNFFIPLTYDEFERWKINGWMLPSSVDCIIREEDIKTGAITEKVYCSYKAAVKYIDDRTSGKKYDDEGNVRPQEPDHATCDFAKSAQIFKKVRDLVAKNATYVTMRKTWRNNE